MPAYNAEQTLEKTCREIQGIADEVILVDDLSADNTYDQAKKLGINHVIKNAITKLLKMGQIL